MELVYSESAPPQRDPRSCPTASWLSPRAAADMVAFEALVVRKTPAVVAVARRVVGDAEDAPRRGADGLPARVGAAPAATTRGTRSTRGSTGSRPTSRSTFCAAPGAAIRAHGATLHLVREREESTAARRRRARPRTASSPASSSPCRGRLSGKQKAAFVLREMEDLDTSEIAAILGCGESTVRNHLFNARRILRREIAKLYPGFFRGTGRKP